MNSKSVIYLGAGILWFFSSVLQIASDNVTVGILCFCIGLMHIAAAISELPTKDNKKQKEEL